MAAATRLGCSGTCHRQRQPCLAEPRLAMHACVGAVLLLTHVTWCVRLAYWLHQSESLLVCLPVQCMGVIPLNT